MKNEWLDKNKAKEFCLPATYECPLCRKTIRYYVDILKKANQEPPKDEQCQCLTGPLPTVIIYD